MEKWKDIKNYEGLYQVSNLGRAKSLKYNKERILKPGTTRRGYCIVILAKNNVRTTHTIHRLVYEAFKGELIEGLVIDHISGIKNQNNIENLQQINNRENTVKGNTTKNRSSEYVGVVWDKSRNKWICHIKINGKQKHLGRFDDEEEAAQAYQNALKSLNKIN